MNTRGKTILALLGAFALAGCASDPSEKQAAFFDVPRRGPLPLNSVGSLPLVIDESSGLVAGTKPGVYWTINDSGGATRLFAIDAYGGLVGHAGEAGVRVAKAKNVDWESLAQDFRGNLLIGDFGNNLNRRRDLAIYQVPEPEAATATEVPVTAAWTVHFPEQTDFPPGDLNFDCEAMFVAGGEIYLFTKHRSNSMTALYRLNDPQEQGSNALELVADANLRGMVTGAASWNDGELVAALTYYGIWLFEPRKGNGEHLFEGAVSWLPIRAYQAEGIAFIDRETLILTNEQQDVYHVPISKMSAVSLRP